VFERVDLLLGVLSYLDVIEVLAAVD